MRAIIDEEFWGWRFSSTLLGGFSVLALALALAGLYGVLSHVVSGRLREIGIRISLGAGKLDVFGVVFRKGMLPVLAGIVVGVAGAALLSRLVQGLLYGVSPVDPLTYVGAPLTFVLVALIAVFLPARRAAAVDPASVLREE
jgi:ABC-type antimicrobial peptide transport system permease subunit